MTESQSSSLAANTRWKRYEVQFQDKGAFHSETDSIEQAKHYARSLANWNYAAQIFDRQTNAVVFKAAAYNESFAQKSNSQPSTSGERRLEGMLALEGRSSR